MKRYDMPPWHFDQTQKHPYIVAGRTLPGGYGYQAAVPKGGEGTMTTPRVSVGLLVWPDGGTLPHGPSGQFEYHTLHEEIFVLTGGLNFDDRYHIPTIGYCNHPPFWVHPTNFRAEGELTMLMRSEVRPNVMFETIPDNWDGQEHFATGSPSRCEGVTSLDCDDLPWVPLLSHDGKASGLDAKRIWEDDDDGWTTWLMRVPPGFRARGPAVTSEGGDEIYVIRGDLTLTGNVELHTTGYTCDASKIHAGQGSLASNTGALFVRWTKGAERLWKLPPRLHHS